MSTKRIYQKYTISYRKALRKAYEVAEQTLNEVKAAMKINYFDDAELIKHQAEKYNGQ